MRFGEANVYYPELRQIDSDNFNYVNFLCNLKLNNCLDIKLSELKSKFIKNSTVAIHFRHGNGEKIMGRGANWISPSEGAAIIKTEAEKFLGDRLSKFNFLIFSDSPDCESELLKKIPNSSVPIEKNNLKNQGGIHFNTLLNPIESIQDSVLDMFLMIYCKYILYTQHSTFTIPCRKKIPKSKQKILFKIN